MDERHYFEEAVKGRLAFLRLLGDGEKGRIIIAALGGWSQYFNALFGGETAHIEALRSFVYDAVKHAPTFCLTPDECAALERSSTSYLTTIAFATDIKPPSGLVYFSSPITDPQDGDPTTPVRALLWMVRKRKDFPSLGYMPRCDDEDYVLYIYGLTTDDSIAGEKGGEDRPHMYPNVSVAWLVGVEDGGVISDDPAQQARVTNNRMPHVKLLLTFFALMRQTYFESSKPREVSKKTKDRLRHAVKRHTDLNTDFQIVRFRPRAGSGNKVSAKTGTGKKLTKSTWTIPFWRWQWYPATEENKPVQIDSFPRGPDKTTDRGADKIFRPAKPLGPMPQRGQ